ncbi:Lrp/AsnC family transcriptional regulator [Streptomyces sp. SCSIO 30461]|uniref:Lrp/AsnC family transcriptional regulator n=1 Tax=Streptomyces sp. SCSIO 30461 TaxID=3118085 RepID=UPI0030CC1015
MGVPASAPKEQRHSRSGTEEASGGAFDPVDRHILEIIQADGRITLSELGRRVSLSPAAVAERVRRLESSGVITGYGAHVSPARLGYGIQAFIRVSPYAGHGIGHPRSRELFARPEVLEGHHVVGGDCWILKVATRDTVHLEGVLEQTSALGRTTTSIVLTSPRERRPLSPAARRA